ncbi:MAG: hypothetical protein J6Q03_07420 [Paludibacteraceae bacterium]|nr:hypothetical protein [Paludibacteraceae bacterium]
MNTKIGKPIECTELVSKKSINKIVDNEKDKTQIPLTMDDFLMIPEVIAFPSDIMF